MEENHNRKNSSYYNYYTIPIMEENHKRKSEAVTKLPQKADYGRKR